MNKDKQKLVEEYNENSIATLDDRIAVRTRSSMYIGDVGINGVTVCLREIFDNAVDEFSMGVGDTIDVKIYNGKGKDKIPYAWMEVTDRGRGIPVGPSKEKYIDKDEYKSTLTLVLTTLHSGGKFTTFNNHGYSGSQSGLHGVGASCVNFLSRKFVAIVKRNGGVYSQIFEYGMEKTPVTKIGECSLDDTGTTIGFLLDDTIFKTTIVPSEAQLISLFDETTALNKNLKVNYENQITGTEQVFYHPEGIKSYMNKLCDEKTKLFEEPFYIDTEEKVEDTKIKVEIAFMFDNPEKTHETFRCFANNVANQNGGFHLNGFRDGLKEVINDYAIKAGLIKDELELKYITENISAIISVKGNNFAYEGQTKGKLATIEAKTAVINSIRKAFKEFIKTRKEDIELIVNKAIKTKTVEEAARKARNEARALQKVSNQRSKLPGKLCECTNKIGSYRELIVVEGDSAGGCWTADTLIRLVDNRILTIKEVIEEYEQGKINYVFGCTEDGTIKIEPILDGFLTKKDAQIIRLTLDNGKQIKCTPDHRIMLRDGSYKEAQYLTENDSLMPLIHNIKEYKNNRGYSGNSVYRAEIKDNKIGNQYFKPVYRVVANQYLGEKEYGRGFDTHHIDMNTLNDYPDNLQYLTASEHSKIHTIMWTEEKKKAHSEIMKKYYLDNPYFMINNANIMRNKCLNGEGIVGIHREKIKNDEEYRKMNTEKLQTKKARENRIKSLHEYYENNPAVKEEMSKKSKEQWNDSELLEWRSKKTTEQLTDPEFQKQRRKNRINKALKVLKDMQSKNIEINKQNFDEYKKNIDHHKGIASWQYLLSEYDNENNIINAVNEFNHRIVRIEWLEEKEDVYDITVKETHNFALEAGIFVHNCVKLGRIPEIQSVLPLRGKILNVEKSELNRILGSETIQNIITCLGCGIGDKFNIKKVRYDKLIIMTDSDVDGSHIRILILTLLYNFMKPLIEEGYVYAAVPPLYRIELKDRTYEYIKDDLDLQEVKKKYGNKIIGVTRFKG